ncbi:uncharacterized protein LOC108821206 isoform X5 [Raphanus sativus]|uniref:Uncharacterized protein LOC108821206 isoform X5 n=1 Tax=Raphanus sativus TaxID=3726 RepID=A0A9W3C8I5_RAPSA|nr:uncharacterized protein LOC108821206 isoform X5 [Raphanus sativus]
MFMNSMFDFRHGGSIHKLLMDKKRGSKRIVLRLWWRSSLPVTATLSVSRTSLKRKRLSKSVILNAEERQGEEEKKNMQQNQQ